MTFVVSSIILLQLVVAILIIALLTFVILPLTLAILAMLKLWKSSSSTTTNTQHDFKSSLYVGRVWHTRLLPKIHSFTYPIFIFALDLSEIDLIKKCWGPLNLLLTFNEYDHLINNEGKVIKNDDGKEDENDINNNTNSLQQRILRLIAEKTNNQFQPTIQTHRIVLLTHLSYYGYNFNPVSFYYIIKKSKSKSKSSGTCSSVVDYDGDGYDGKNKNNDDDTENEKLVAIVGEVSNTPWQEMYCYVLHPENTKYDHVQVIELESDNGKNDNNDNNNSNNTTAIDDNTTNSSKNNNSNRIRYKFPKQFHVSPFMEMEYYYDWIFDGIPTSSKTSSKSNNPITVINTLRQKNDTNKLQFKATLKIDNNSKVPKLNEPISLVYYTLIQYPIYCMIIQLWIHYEAMWLFIKGITYIPHPDGSETTASKIIATIMIPFFIIQDYILSKGTGGDHHQSKVVSKQD